MTVSRSFDAGGSMSSGGGVGHGSPSASWSPARCACVTSGNSTGGRLSTVPVLGVPGRLDRRACRRSRRDDRERELVDAVGADEARDLRVREAGVQARLAGQRERLGEHRAGVPVEVAEAALGVLPAGAPRDAGDDQRRRVAVRRWPDRAQRVVDRVVPVHAACRPRRRPRAGSGRPRSRRRGSGRSGRPRARWSGRRRRRGTGFGRGRDRRVRPAPPGPRSRWRWASARFWAARSSAGRARRTCTAR